MYRDLTHVIEDFKQKGYRNLFEDQEFRENLGSADASDLIGKMKILEIYHFDEGTDPGDESTVYLLKQPDQSHCYIVLSYGMYKDPAKTELIDTLKNLEEER